MVVIYHMGRSTKDRSRIAVYTTVNEQRPDESVRNNNEAFKYKKFLDDLSSNMIDENIKDAFCIHIFIDDVTRTTMRQSADFVRHEGCPQFIATAGMDILTAIRNEIRRKKKEYKKEVREKEEKKHLVETLKKELAEKGLFHIEGMKITEGNIVLLLP